MLNQVSAPDRTHRYGSMGGVDSCYPKFKAKTSRYTKNKLLFSVSCAFAREKAHGGMMFCFSWGKSADSEKPRGLVRSLLS